jgi:tRNA-Thr(GGU) m(6)t(6)A37 methyltransferase TsaA
MPTDNFPLFQFRPIGTFHCAESYPYDAARQGTLAASNAGVVRLEPGNRYELALRDIEGFSHLWLIYVFHHNPHWKPLIQPPRRQKKVGVFASRAPYRPNPIGLSCVELVAINGLELTVRGHDLLDGTPILDIKPYLLYADSIPDARNGWLKKEPVTEFSVETTSVVKTRLDWLAERGVRCLESFLLRQLGHSPNSRKRKRVRPLSPDTWEIAYRTWRADFTIDPAQNQVRIHAIRSGYSPVELADSDDPYADKALHRTFNATFNP